MSPDPTDLLRALNPAPAATAPPIERLWRRLEQTNTLSPVQGDGVDLSAERSDRERAAGRRPDGRSRRASGWGSRVLVAGLLGVALAIGVGAVVVLHANHPPAGPAPAVQHALPSPARGLVGILGVLRRPQTPADRDLGPSLTAVVHHSLVGKPVESLVRVAGVTPDGQRVVLVPMQPRHGSWPPRPSGPRTGLRLGLFAGGGGCCLTPAAIEDGQAWDSAGGSSGNYVVIVVPDGVARVRVAFSHPVTAPVHDNVAVFSVPKAVENLNIYPMTWFGPSGAVVKRFRSSLPPAPTPGQAADQRLRALRADRQANVHTSRPILDNFELFGAALPSNRTFGIFPANFVITHPPLTVLPTYILRTGSGAGYAVDVNNARMLTTQTGLRVWLLAGRVICIYGPSSQAENCTGDPGSTLRFGLVNTVKPPRGPRLLLAVVPSASHTITLTTTSGREIVPVHDGVALAVATAVTGVAYKSSTGTRITERAP
jgi:hypothetical protein